MVDGHWFEQGLEVYASRFQIPRDQVAAWFTEQCHTHLAAECATPELEGARHRGGAVPHRWGLGSGPGVCVLLDRRGPQAGRAVRCENNDGDRALLRLW